MSYYFPININRKSLGRSSVAARPLLLALWLCTLVHSCSSPQPINRNHDIADVVIPTNNADRLFPADRFELDVAGEDALSGDFTVPSDGGIEFQWIGRVEVAGRTCTEIAADISARLADGFLLNPSVNCQIKEIISRRIDVIGEVNRPGSFVYEDNMTILRAIARAEGFGDNAAPNGTNVLRIVDGHETRIRIPMDDIIDGQEPNFPLLPGDTVVVPEYALIP